MLYVRRRLDARDLVAVDVDRDDLGGRPEASGTVNARLLKYAGAVLRAPRMPVQI